MRSESPTALQALIGVSIRALAHLMDVIYGAEALNVVLKLLPMQSVPALLRSWGAVIGDNVRFRSPLTIHNADLRRRLYYCNLNVGRDCYLGRDLFLDLQDRIVIESNVTISHRVMILTHTDAGMSPLRDVTVPTSQAPVIIRSGAYIGANVTILQGVEIGARAVVGAGSVVTRLVAPESVVAGVPAKAIRTAAETAIPSSRAGSGSQVVSNGSGRDESR